MNRIRELRAVFGWTQAQLAQKIGTARTTVTMYEKEQRQLDPATIHALCDLFGCTADYLLGRSASPEPVVTEEDAQLLAAFHAAPPETQAAIRLLIMPPHVENKKAV